MAARINGSSRTASSCPTASSYRSSSSTLIWHLCVRAWQQQQQQQQQQWPVWGDSISLYDHDPQTGLRHGDPIADCYGAINFANGAIMALADGVSWGERPKVAARAAVLGFPDTHVQGAAAAACQRCAAWGSLNCDRPYSMAAPPGLLMGRVRSQRAGGMMASYMARYARDCLIGAGVLL